MHREVLPAQALHLFFDVTAPDYRSRRLDAGGSDPLLQFLRARQKAVDLLPSFVRFTLRADFALRQSVSRFFVDIARITHALFSDLYVVQCVDFLKLVDIVGIVSRRAIL